MLTSIIATANRDHIIVPLARPDHPLYELFADRDVSGIQTGQISLTDKSVNEKPQGFPEIERAFSLRTGLLS